MESRGRKRKVSGTILAGTFTVPAAMSAVQQNAVNANLFTKSTDSVSNFFAERSLKNFLKVTTYAILPAVIVAVLGGLGIYKLYKYFTSTKTSAESDYWKVLNREEKYNGYSEKLLYFLGTYEEELGIVGTKIEVDSKVLFEVLDKDSKVIKEVRNLLGKKEKVTFYVDRVYADGYLNLSIINEAGKKNFSVQTKYFDNNINGVINFFNKIFEQSSKNIGKNIKLILEEKGKEILLKIEGAREEIEINIDNNRAAEWKEKVIEIYKLLQNLALVRAFTENDEGVKYNEVNKKLIKGVLKNIKLKGKKFKAKVGDLKKILKGIIASAEKFNSVCEEKNIKNYECFECKIENIFDSEKGGYYIHFSINDIKSDKDEGETTVWYTTKPLCNDTNALIEFFNMIFEANKDENGDYCKIVKKEENGEISSIDLCSYNEKENLIKPGIRIYTEEEKNGENDINNNNDNIIND